MKNIVLFISFWFLMSACNSQSNNNSYDDELVLIYEVYKNVNAPNKDFAAIEQSMNDIKTPNLKFAASFINEWIKPKHEIISDTYLKKPDLESLKAIYLIRHLAWNSMTTGEFKPKEIMAQIDFYKVTEHELLNTYYCVLFNKMLTQYQPNNYANVNLDFNALDLKTPIEKAIFYYNSVYAFGTKYMMQARSKTNPCQRAQNYLRMMPKYEGKIFAEYEIEPFQDFKVNIANNKKDASFLKHFTASYNNAMATYRKCK